MSFPLTVAQTPGEGAASFLQPARRAHATAARIRTRRVKPNSFQGGSTSRGFCYATRSNAGSADTNVHVCAFHHRPNSAEIWVPATARHVMGVADRVSVLRLLIANLTCECHWCVAPNRNLV